MLSNLSIQLYQDLTQNNRDREYKSWHCSDLATCPRSQYFKRKGIKSINNPTGAKILRWGGGHALEEAIRPSVARMYKEVISNKRYTSKKLDTTGEVDNLSIPDKTIIEIKSISDFALVQRSNQLTLKEATGQLNRWNKPEYQPKLTPYLHHELQNHGYVMLLAEKNITVDFIDYVYITLNGRIVTYHTEVQKSLLEALTRRITELNLSWKNQTPPDCICTPDNPLWGATLQWCEFKSDNECCSLKLLEASNDN